MSEDTERVGLQARKKQLKLLMILMLVFMVAGPLLAPKLFAEQFSQLGSVGRYVLYTSAPAFFAFLFVIYYSMYRRVDRKLKALQ